MTTEILQQELNEALINTIRSNKYNFAKFLIDNGADVNLQDEFGNTALMEATKHNKTELAELFIKNGADVNLKDKYGNTALDIAKYGLEFYKKDYNQEMVEKYEKIIELLTK